MTSKNIYDLENELLNPASSCYIDALLDVVSMAVADCDYQSAHKSKNIQKFRSKFSEVVDLISECRTKISDFDSLKIIGRGGFGKVHLVRHKQTRRVYAMKVMNKAHLLDHSQSAFWEERDIMVQANNTDWLVACHEAFMDLENIYICMDFMPGGDLYYWLEEYGQFTEKQTKFYLAETVLALDVLHSLGYIHRDLKPDNLLLDARGHLKLADFGSCVRLDEQKKYFCSHPMGTPDYISPEMLDCQSKPGFIGPECDWWSLGIICYEMLFGEPPFYGESLVETYCNILAHEKTLKINREYSTDISEEAENFIRSLLKTTSQRLGNDSVLSIKNHAFFQQIDWVNLNNSDAPIRPVVNSEIDTSNIKFDSRELSDPNHSISSSSGCSSILAKYGGNTIDPNNKKKFNQTSYFTGDNLSFAGFTYKRDQRYCRHLLKNLNINNNYMIPMKNVAPDSTINTDGVSESTQNMDEIIHSLRNQLSLSHQKLLLTKNELDEEKSSLSVLRGENASLLEAKKCLDDELIKAQLELTNLRSDLECLSKQQKLLTSHNSEAKMMTASETLEPTVDTSILLQSKVDRLKSSDSSEKVIELQAVLDTALSQIRAYESLKANHLERIDDLNEQIEATTHFSQFYQTELEAWKVKYQSIKESYEARINELETRVSELTETLKQKDLDLKNFDTQLANKELTLQHQTEQYESEKANWNTSMQNMSTTISSLQNQIAESNEQRSEITTKCSELEVNVQKMTTETIRLQKDNSLLQVKFDQTLKKLVELAHNSKLGSLPQSLTSSFNSGPYVRNAGRDENAENFYQLEKKYKNLDSKYKELEVNTQNKIHQLKQDLSERTEMLASLTDDNQKITNELAENKAQLAQLYDILDKNGYGKYDNKNAETVLSYSTSDETSDTIDGDDQSKPNEVIINLECKLDLPSKGRGREKLVWDEKYAVLRPGQISFYNKREEKDKGIPPFEEIHICQILHAREASSLDVHHAKKEDVPRVLQLFYDDSLAPNEEDSFLNMSTATSSSTSLSPSIIQDGTVNWQNHTFHLMTFRFANQLCDVCHRPCSDIFHPPPGMECIKCRMRIHAEHVEKGMKFVSCNNATKIRLLRMSSESEKKIWIGQIRSFIDRYKMAMEIPGSKLDSRSYSIATFHARRFYKSLRSQKSISGNSLVKYTPKNTSTLANDPPRLEISSTPLPCRENKQKSTNNSSNHNMNTSNTNPEN